MSAATGATFTSRDPATGETIWEAPAAGATEIAQAVDAARGALATWSELTTDRRIEHLTRCGEALKQRRTDLLKAICRSTGKPRWESATEVDAVFGKIALSIDAMRERRSPVEKQIPCA